VVSVERGHDPREFAFVAFGGAGAMHACDLARSLRIPRVIVPACPGALSALGILISDVVKDRSRTVLLRAKELPRKKLEQIYSELRREAAAELARENWQGRAVFELSADLRYRGQGYELTLAYGPDILQRFHAAHERRYGYGSPEREIEIVTVRVRGRVASPEKLASMKVEERASRLRPVTSPVWFGGKRVPTLVLPRAQLKSGRRYRGPAIITEYSATTVVPPGLIFQQDRVGNLVIEVR
jgi:N-methylhydantoinase A